MSNSHLVSFSVSHTFSLPSCPPTLLSLSAQADRKCQVRPGYFRPNWEIDVPPETWHLDMPFILPHALPPKRQEPDMLTARWNTDNCPFWGLFSANQKQGWHRSDKQHQRDETTSWQKASEEMTACACHLYLPRFHSTGLTYYWGYRNAERKRVSLNGLEE